MTPTSSTFAAVLLAVTYHTAQAQPSPDAAIPLDSVEVHGQRTLIDSRRPEYNRMLPCISCEDETQDREDLVLSLLRFVLLPNEPADLRAYTPISLQQPRDRHAVQQP